jgi:putative colanic acid biosynthesis glycosyltransferase
MDMINIDIITVHLNDLAGLETTYQSLQRVLGTAGVSWIVIDGGTSIESPAAAARINRIKGAATCFISEPDAGIYDAMNKGTEQAQGDYVLYLNAGDELHPEFKTESLNLILGNESPDMIWGRCEVRYQDGVQIKVKTRTPAWAWYGLPANHPGIFFRRSSLGMMPYDTSYRLAADYDLVCRLLSEDASVAQLRSFISIFHRGGASDRLGKTSRDEENIIRKKYFKIPAIVANGVKFFKEFNAGNKNAGRLMRFWRRWM